MADTKGEVRLLRDRLETERLAAIQDLSGQIAAEAAIPADLLRRVADLHTVLTAVQDAIEQYELRVGFVSDEPLASR